MVLDESIDGAMAATGGPAPVDDPIDAAVQRAIDEGQRMMDNDRFSDALRVIMDAIALCPCRQAAGNGKAHHGKDKSCNIKQCITVVSHQDADALYQVTQGPCACGYAWPSCTRPHHALALDALAECLDRAGQPVSAFSTALATVRLDPASAIGYCRGARIMRHLLKNSFPKPSPSVARTVAAILRGDGHEPSALRLRRLLLRFVKYGLDNTDRHRRRPKDSYDVVLQRMAYNLKLQVARKDPVMGIPNEILSMVFSQLDRSTVSRCLRVSKQWHHVIMGDRVLWADLRLHRPRNPGRFLGSFLQHHRDITSLVIHDTTDFQPTETKIATVLRGLPRLQRLYLNAGATRKTVDWTNVGQGVLFRHKSLTQLSVINFDMRPFVVGLMGLCLDKLEVLDLIDVGNHLNGIFDSIRLPNLKKLRIVEPWRRPTPNVTRDLGEPLTMKPVVRATPSLEQLHLDGLMVQWHWDPFAEPTPIQDNLWPALRQVTLGRHLLFIPLAELTNIRVFRFLPPFTSNMRSIEILCNSPTTTYGVLHHHPPADNPQQHDPIIPRFPNLEVFRCTGHALSLPTLRAVLAPAAETGALQVLELSVANAPHHPPAATLPASFDPATDLAFLHELSTPDNPPSIHTLGLHAFNFHSDSSGGGGGSSSSAFDGQPFVDWLDCFPKLHAVGVYPGMWEGVAEWIARLVLRDRGRDGGVEVIHQEVLAGVARDQVLALARGRGVEVRHSPGGMPYGWPVIDD